MANLTKNESAVRVVPPVDIYEGEKDYLLVLDVPGVEGANIDVEVDRDLLKVSAKRSDGAEQVRYQREFRVPADVDGSGVTAKAKDGVLELVLPKHETAQPKRFAVSSN